MDPEDPDGLPLLPPEPAKDEEPPEELPGPLLARELDPRLLLLADVPEVGAPEPDDVTAAEAEDAPDDPTEVAPLPDAPEVLVPALLEGDGWLVEVSREDEATVPDDDAEGVPASGSSEI